jgi:hypothetical protein
MIRCMIGNKTISRAAMRQSQYHVYKKSGVITRSDTLNGLFDQVITCHIHHANSQNKIENPPAGFLFEVDP